jgi:MoxR-like ATPase
MTINPQQAQGFAQTFDRIVANISTAIRGKEHVVRLALTCLLSEGHLLLEDNPGTGKTSLAKALASTVHASNSRIQFTPDLLPSDVVGVPVFDQRTNEFEFRRGPIFHHIVLADEINRASPKTQSALLQVMEESQVTVDGITYEVPRPFMVIATQNPIEQAGTYRLPEAQLDRFLMKTSIGYPDQIAMVGLLTEASIRDRAGLAKPLVAAQVVQDMANVAANVHVAVEILDYISRLAEATRDHPSTRLGVSVRGCLALVRAAKTWAIAQGRPMVLPDDIRDLAVPVLTHRLLLTPEARFDEVSVEELIAKLLVEVEPPRDRRT